MTKSSTLLFLPGSPEEIDDRVTQDARYKPVGITINIEGNARPDDQYFIRLPETGESMENVMIQGTYIIIRI